MHMNELQIKNGKIIHVYVSSNLTFLELIVTACTDAQHRQPLL